MHVIRRRGWEIPERLATPEHLFLDRRAFLGRDRRGRRCRSSPEHGACAQRVADLPDPTTDLYPVKRNETFTLDRPVTDEKINTNYNNFYEFGSTKNDRAGGAGAASCGPGRSRSTAWWRSRTRSASTI